MGQLTNNPVCVIITALVRSTMKTTAQTARATVRPLNPRSADTKFMGDEPTWRVQPIYDRISQLTKAFSWYNYFYGKKDARDMVVSYLETHGRKNDVRLLRGVPDSALRLTTGWMCRMSMVGLDLTEAEQIQLDNMLAETLGTKQQAEVEKTDTAPARQTIQDRLREKLTECAGELEGLFDDFVVSGAKMSADIKPITVIRGKNVAPQMVNEIAADWKRKLTEFETVIGC